MVMAEQALPKPRFTPAAFADLRGWVQDNHAEALAAFQRSCTEILQTAPARHSKPKYAGALPAWHTVCRAALLPPARQQPRQFFEQYFQPLRVSQAEGPEGLFTGYYEPEVSGRLQRSQDYAVPLYAKPDDLVGFTAKQAKQAGTNYGRIHQGKAQAYFTRQEIEQGALAGRGLELVWLKSRADAFFIHIQGSGRINLGNGKMLRVAFAAKSGRPYTAIGATLIAQGIITREAMSMQLLRDWLARNPKDAQSLMWQNQSFIFFKAQSISDPSLGATGAQKVPLTPWRSLAVDRSLWKFGTPIWLETTLPTATSPQPQAFRQLMIAQDTGSAIRGVVRGDIYCGWGAAAAEYTAGHMKNQGTITVLLPRPVAQKLLRAP